MDTLAPPGGPADPLSDLPLLGATAPAWGRLAARRLDLFLADHAVCEQQAALSALNLVAHYPEDGELLDRMTSLASEEIAHFRRVVGLLRKRVQSVFGEFRSLSGEFDLVSVNGLPGIRPPRTSELWVGRMLVLATPPLALAGAICSDEVPAVLASNRRWRRRLAVHLRCSPSALPEGMGPRLILLPEPETEGMVSGPVILSSFARPDDVGAIDLVARGVPDADGDYDAKGAEGDAVAVGRPVRKPVEG